jgi:phosphatidylglycerophosphate synthase
MSVTGDYSETTSTAGEQPRERYRDTLARLQYAQKSGRGPAYLRYVNRRLGRPLAAGAYHLGLSPNMVTVISAMFTFGGLAVLATAEPSGIVGLVVTVLLLVGFALDSADGQLARLRGGGSSAGEWLDHVVDAVKVSSIHLAVLLSLHRSGELDDAWLLVPLGFGVVGCVAYFANQLYDQLVRHGGGNRRPPSRLAASLLLLPTDYGVLCFTFVLLGSVRLFIAAYTSLFVMRTAILMRALAGQYRDIRAIDRQAR